MRKPKTRPFATPDHLDLGADDLLCGYRTVDYLEETATRFSVHWGARNPTVLTLRAAAALLESDLRSETLPDQRTEIRDRLNDERAVLAKAHAPLSEAPCS